MKASLPALKKTRLPWFDETTSVDVSQQVEIQYNTYNVTNDKLSHLVLRKYTFKFSKDKSVPASDIILMVEGMPFLMTETPGNIGEKLSTSKLEDPTIVIEDRIAKRVRGEEKITTEDVPYKNQILERRIREDSIFRRIIVKNESGKDISLNMRIIESADVQIVKTIPEAEKIEKPTFEWSLSLVKDDETSVEIELKFLVETMTHIDKSSETQSNQGIKQIFTDK